MELLLNAGGRPRAAASVKFWSNPRSGTLRRRGTSRRPVPRTTLGDAAAYSFAFSTPVSRAKRTSSARCVSPSFCIRRER